MNDQMYHNNGNNNLNMEGVVFVSTYKHKVVKYFFPV
jgi:hypothetical protein